MSIDGLVCYTIGDDFVTSTNQYFPCGPSGVTNAKAQNCCYAGDYCLQGGICHYTHFVQNGTGYYLAACTDPTWKDPACRKVCTSQYGQDIVYDSSAGHWNCCDVTSTEKDCENPTDITLQAPAPQDLQTVLHLTQSVPPVTLTQIGSIVSPIISASQPAPAKSSSKSSPPPLLTSTSTSTSSPFSAPTLTARSKTENQASTISSGLSKSGNTATTLSTGAPASPTLTQSRQHSGASGLSTGAKAGVGIGIAIGVLVLLALLFLLFRRRRTASEVNNSDRDPVLADRSPVLEKYRTSTRVSAVVPSELPGWSDSRSQDHYKEEQPIPSPSHTTHELPAHERRHELPTAEQ